MLAFIVLACAQPGPTAAVNQRCEAYGSMPDVYGYCITSLAGGLPDVRDCDHADRWADQCRTVWVEARLQPGSGVEMAALLAACSTADCRLDVLDFRADPALLVQVERCGAWAEENAPHCVSHAVQRWRATQPSAEAFAEIAAWDGILADWLGHHLAEAVVCDGVAPCGGSASVQAHCERAAVALRSGEAPCHDPANAPRPMQSGQRSPASEVRPAKSGQRSPVSEQ